MDHTSLDIFRVVAAELSVTRAAKRLGRVQSNVTTRIQQLEEELGVALFRRDGNRLTLSAEGERFLGYANRRLALADEARQVLSQQAPSGTLRIGSMESTAAARLPGPLAALHVQYPGVQLRISTAPSRQLLEQVRSGLLDCAFAALPPCGDMASASDLEAAGLLGEPVFREEFLLEPTEFRTHVVAKVDTWLVHRNGYQTAAFDALREALSPFMSTHPTAR